MTLASAIIADAFREGNLTPIGVAPTAAEQAEALTRLNTHISSVFGHEMGEELTDWLVPQPQRTAPVAANFPQLPYPQNTDPLLLSSPNAGDVLADVYKYPPPNSRIIFGGVTTTAYFPESPNDGARMGVVQGSGAGDNGVVGRVLTLNGNGRTIATANTATFTFASPAATPQKWLYRADTGSWVAVTTLALTDQLPFPAEFDDVWVCWLAVRLAPRFNKAASAETKAAFSDALRRLKARYRQAGTTTFGAQDIPRSRQSYRNGDWM